MSHEFLDRGKTSMIFVLNLSLNYLGLIFNMHSLHQQYMLMTASINRISSQSKVGFRSRFAPRPFWPGAEARSGLARGH
jgi:hypothetical protein